jgi:hypothetical protein
MGWTERSTADKFAFVGMAIGGCIGVLLAVDADFLVRILVIGAGAGLGFGLGRLIGGMVSRR